MAWRDIFNEAFIDVTLKDYPNWKTEGQAVFYHLRGRTKLDKEFTTGGIENYLCTERLGIAGVTQPAVLDSEKVEKRWLKSPEIVVAHEFGHLFMLKHSPPRLLDSKIAKASGFFNEHLAHDACLMNYDADTLSLCGWCMLRKRGWQIEKVITDGLGKGDSPAWVKECRKKLEADASKGIANKVRLAMFLLDMHKFDSSAGDLIKEATDQMVAARKEVPENKNDEKNIFLLRCEVVFYNKIGNAVKAKECLEKLKTKTEFKLDIDDLQDKDGNVDVNSEVASNWLIVGG